MYIDQIKILQIDLVSSCNARCPSCYRQNVNGDLNKNFAQNIHLDLDLLDRVLREPAMAALEEVFLCGNYGDAMASPYIVEVFDMIKRVNPKLALYVHTNGGLGKRQTWLELAHRLNGKGSFMKFAIDGLEDTNQIYRRQVSWSQVMRNVRTFIDAGGRAVWKFVIFEHNKHQIEAARRMASEMGFVRFETTPNYSPGQEPYLEKPRGIAAEIREPSSLPSDGLSQKELGATEISCFAQKENSAFLDFEGSIWPCCWMAGWKYSSSSYIRKRHQQYFSKASRENLEFNSLKKFSVDEVLSHPWFSKDLMESWTQPLSIKSERTHALCIEKCGKCLEPSATIKI